MICCYCKEEKDVSLFYKDKHSKIGYKPRCKQCDSLSLNKENRANYEKEYREKNKEKRKSIVKKSMELNKEHHKQKRKEYLKTESGQSSYRKYTQKRYALKKLAFVENVSPLELYNEQNGICYICNQNFEFKKMELDHVLPISKGGKHKKDNCKMACVRCNRRKGSKLLEEVCYQMV